MKSKIIFLFIILQSVNIHAQMAEQEKMSNLKRISRVSVVAKYSYAEDTTEFFDHSKTN
ncbi:MAG: hypothetical protein IT257_02985 [Chitinophagaceae bacterium]|nr:hypothetical protein [Chitinophagaceae bacterium]